MEENNNHTTVSIDAYLHEVEVLKDSIKLFIKEKRNAYYANDNDSLTEVFIDTVLFSPQKNKIAFFAITRNSNNKLLNGGKKNEYHYDAHFFVGQIKDSIIKNIVWFTGYNLTNYQKEEDASSNIRELYFKDLNKGAHNKLKYNVGDIRFWNDSSIWH